MLSPVKTAILSYGMSGEVFHAPLLHASPLFEVVAIVERNSNRAVEHYPYVKTVRSIEEVLEDSSVELVVVNTPNETHFEFALAALERGKHVVVEKPFTVTSSEAGILIEKAISSNLIMSVFQNRRWDSDFLTVQKVLASGDLGKLVEYEAHYDRFRNYVEQNTWKEHNGNGTGILYNLGSHMLDQVLVLFGLPLWLDARIGTRRVGGRVPDFYDIRLEYEQHLVIVKSSYLVRESLPRYIVHGTNGSFVKYGMDIQEQALKEKISPLIDGWGKEPENYHGRLNVLKDAISIETNVPSEVGNYLDYYDNIFHAIRTGAPLQVKPQQSRAVIELIEACYQSNENRRAIRMR